MYPFVIIELNMGFRLPRLITRVSCNDFHIEQDPRMWMYKILQLVDGKHPIIIIIIHLFAVLHSYLIVSSNWCRTHTRIP